MGRVIAENMSRSRPEHRVGPLFCLPLTPASAGLLGLGSCNAADA